MTGIPSLTHKTRPAVEFGHRYLALPLIEAIRSAVERITLAVSQGDTAGALAEAAQLRESADLQDRWTCELLAQPASGPGSAPTNPPSGGSSGSKR